MKNLMINERNFSIPGEWNDMTIEQLEFLASMINSESCTAQEIKLKMILFSLGARIRRYTRATGDGYAVTIDNKTEYLTPEELASLSTLFDFLFVENENNYVLDIKLTRNPLKKIIVKSRFPLIGPDDGMTNISYGQFIMLQTWQQRMKYDDKNALDNLLSIIWKNSDTFSISDEEEPKLIRYIKNNTKTVMFWFYTGCMNFISEKFSRVFSGSGTQSDTNVFDMQQRIVDEMAGGDITKKEIVKRCLLYDALYTMEAAIEREEKRNKE